MLFSILNAALPAPAPAQEPPAERPLGLEEAVAEALARNGDLEAATARNDAVRADAREASSFLYPRLELDAGTIHSDDPVSVFGTRLRQERFSQADFEIESLNRPDAVTDWTAGAEAGWRILDASAWAGREAARLGSRASELGLERRRQATAFRTRVLYLRALAAGAQVEATREGLEAARASLDVVRERRTQGMLTEADVLQGEAEIAGARAQLADARRARYEARSRLGVHLGWSTDTLPRPTDELLEADGPTGVTASSGTLDRVSGRADLRALERKSDAADARVSQAVRARLPTVEAFGRLSSHAPDPTGDRTANFMLGVQLSWPAFTGFARESSIDRARSMERAARAEHTQRLREARAEVAQARRAVEAAREGAEAAEAAASAAREARRLVRRRFEEGLTTTAQLLQADARATRMESRAIDARTAQRIAAAHLGFVLGGVPTTQ